MFKVGLLVRHVVL